ncbi:MAG TPA: hypothetical protein VIY51_03465 [Xanthobacteraceae bacterium]
MSRLLMMRSAAGPKIALACLSFLVLVVALVQQPAKRLRDFDQPFYITIAYDLDRHGIFSNGIFVDIDSTVAVPRSGMFFAPVYPLVVLAAMKVDPRFAEAVACSVEADRGHRDEATCEPYATPMRIIHALLLALGIVAVAGAGRQIFGSRAVFWLAGALATLALAAEADIFSYVMTESMTFSLYSLFAAAILHAWRAGRPRHYVLAGGLLGALALTRLSFFPLFLLVAGLSLLHGYQLSQPRRPSTGMGVLGMMLVFALLLGGWGLRNAISVGKLGLTEEYGSAALIERFAYDDMSSSEFFFAFPYCTPGLGELAFDKVSGADSMHRFAYDTPGSFFNMGRDRRNALVKEHGRLDPLIGGIARDELRDNWWRHLVVAIPLAWCGMWPGHLVSLLLVPLFGVACVRAVRHSQWQFLLYAAPAIAMLALHALVANHYTRYNIILIGPFAVGAAWIICEWTSKLRWRRPGDIPARA